MPKKLPIIKNAFVSSDIIIKAIRRFIDSSLKGEKKYEATYEILKKKYPKIKNLKEGEACIKGKNFRLCD